MQIPWVRSSHCNANSCVETSWVRSSYCASNACVEVNWRKACADKSCVEVAAAGDEILVRDSKDPDGTVLRFTLDEWTAFTAGVRAGQFDQP